LRNRFFYFFFENVLFIFQFENKKQKRHLVTEWEIKVSPVTRHPKFLNSGDRKMKKRKFLIMI